MDVREAHLNEDLIVRYLLGELPEAEQVEIEDSAFQNQQYMQDILSVESDLIDDYVRGEISRHYRERFEKHFLAAPERRRKVEFARALAAVTSEIEPERVQDVTRFEFGRPSAGPCHTSFQKGVTTVFTIMLFISLAITGGAKPQSCNPAVVSYVVRDEKGSVLNEAELQTIYAQLPKKIGDAGLEIGQVSIAENGENFYWPEALDWSGGRKEPALEFANAATCTMQLSEVTLLYHDRKMHLIFNIEIDRTTPNRRPVVDSLPFQEGTFVLDLKNWAGERDRIIPALHWKKLAAAP